jgi:PAS domain S-box-containing protein
MIDQSWGSEPEETGGVADLKRRDADNALVLGLTDDFLKISSEEELMQVVGAKLAAHLELDSYSFFDFDEGRGELTNSTNWSSPDVPDLRGTYRLAEYVSDDFIPGMRLGSIYVINDTQNLSPTIAQWASQLQVRAGIVIPYQRDDTWKGCFAVTDRHPREWRREEVELVRHVASRTFPQIERIRAVKQLASSNRSLHAILSSIQDDFYVLDRDWVFRFVTPTFTARTGREPKDFLGRNIWELLPKHVGSELYKNLHIAMEKRETRRFDSPGKYTDGWYITTAFPWEEGIAVLATDISKLKQVERALQESEARYRRIVETANEGIWEIDKDVRTTFVNQRMAEMLGYRADEIMGRSPFEFLFPEDTIAGEQRLDRARAGRPTRAGEFRYRRKDGSALWTLATSSPQLDEQGNFLGSFAMIMDITESRRAREALRESEAELRVLNASLEQRVMEKTAEVRNLAADITKAVQRERSRLSHVLHDDLQQRIHAIRMQLSLLRDELQNKDDKARHEATDIERQLSQVLELTRDLSIELNPPILREEGLAQAIGWLADRSLLRYGLRVKVGAEEPFAIPDQELHVFLVNCVRELLFNTVKHAEASRAEVILRRLGDRLQIEVSDDGKGFAEPEAEEQRGEGDESVTLGIPAMRRQLTVFGGIMEIVSVRGTGSRITLTVPISR